MEYIEARNKTEIITNSLFCFSLRSQDYKILRPKFDGQSPVSITRRRSSRNALNDVKFSNATFFRSSAVKSQISSGNSFVFFNIEFLGDK